MRGRFLRLEEMELRLEDSSPGQSGGKDVVRVGEERVEPRGICRDEFGRREIGWSWVWVMR
jgi:hypothetical protein